MFIFLPICVLRCVDNICDYATIKTWRAIRLLISFVSNWQYKEMNKYNWADFLLLHSLKGDKNTMKHKKMRGVVAMLLTLVMVAGMLPTSVYASDADGGGDSVVLESVSDLIEVSSVN